MSPEPVCETLRLEPSPDAEFIGKLADLIRKMVVKEGWAFGCISESMNDDIFEISAEEMGGPDVMMPLVLHQASLAMKEAYGAPAAMAYRADPIAMCAAIPDPQEPTASLVTWALFAHYVLEERVLAHQKEQPGSSMTSLGPWQRDWDAALNEKTLHMLPPVAQPSASAPTLVRNDGKA